ncbi:Transcriptional corepressor LEUNIG-like protein [Gossypium australe]|uniref:Transcriptional corepressor LEUNIG-like protein n=1 Tax=Gossypium australe TaxID=47621 RepID=A0A5B6WFB5_9ROSI|nr:Transcriptional corepressor LEUNIG-like protein [Gossypium australe]
MAQSNWEADKMLDVYIYDYLVKKKLHVTAKSFMTEGKVAPDPVAIDAPGGFLFEWWSVFWDIFISRTNDKHSEAAAAYIEAQQIKAKEQQQLQMQQLQLMRQAQMQRRDPNHPSLSGPVNATGSEGMLGQSNASALAAKMYEERMKHPNAMNSETSQPLLDARMALLKSATNHPGQLVQGNQGSVTAALQQIQALILLTFFCYLEKDIKGDVNMGGPQRAMPMDPSIYGQGIMQSKPGIGNTGLNPGVGSLPLKGWPLTGIDQIRPNLGAQVQKPFIQNANQFQLLPQQQQQQVLAQVQTQGNVGSSPMYGDMDSQRFSGLSRGTLNAKEGQPIVNDGSIGSPMQSTSSKQMNMPPIRQSSSQQDPLQSQHVQQNNRKRKGASSSGAANSTGTGNTVGPSNSQPSTPSTHTPGDAVAAVSNMQHGSSMSKNLMMYGSDGTGGIASSTNQLEDMEHFGDVGSLDDNVESFLSHDDGDGGNLFGTLKRNPSEHATETSKGFGFNEVGSIRKSNGKVTCCHFSSDGKLLASAGHDKKAVLWNTETLETECTPEEHTHIITDIRFRPNSTQLATSSFDTTVRVWDAAQGGCSNVRFQPRIGQFLAAAAETVVSIVDVETDRRTQLLQGHNTEVHSICWDTNGDFLASVSQDAVRVWSLASGECIHELNSSGNKFHSCVFHPSFPALLVVGGYQSLELWNTAENKCMTIPAHDCVISALTQSQVTGMVASASYDKSVKIWK